MCSGVPSTAGLVLESRWIFISGSRWEKGEGGVVELDTGAGSAMGFLSLGGLGESPPACVPDRDVDPDC